MPPPMPAWTTGRSAPRRSSSAVKARAYGSSGHRRGGRLLAEHVDHREAHREARPARGRLADLDRAAVALGDRAHYGEPEARPRLAAVAHFATHEAIKHPRSQVGGHARPVVGDLDRRGSLLDMGAGVNTGSRRRVHERVLDQVASEAVELVARALDADGHLRAVGLARARDRHDVIARERGDLGACLAQYLDEVDWLAPESAARVRARKQKQVADEPAHASRRAQRRARELAILALERGP